MWLRSGCFDESDVGQHKLVIGSVLLFFIHYMKIRSGHGSEVFQSYTYHSLFCCHLLQTQLNIFQIISFSEIWHFFADLPLLLLYLYFIFFPLKPGSGFYGFGSETLVSSVVPIIYSTSIIKISGGNNIVFFFNRSHMGAVEEIPRLALPSFQRAVLHLRQHTVGATSCQAQWPTGRNFGDITQRSLKCIFFVFCFWATFLEVSSVADPGFLSRIPNPNFFHPGSRIRIEELTRKYDPGCSSQIADPGVKKATDPGSATLEVSVVKMSTSSVYFWSFQRASNVIHHQLSALDWSDRNILVRVGNTVARLDEYLDRFDVAALDTAIPSEPR